MDDIFSVGDRVIVLKRGSGWECDRSETALPKKWCGSLWPVSWRRETYEGEKRSRLITTIIRKKREWDG